MKNLSVTMKLVVGFGAMLLCLVVSYLFSAYSISSISGQTELYAQYTVPNAEHLRSMQVNMGNIMQDLLEAIVEDDPVQVKAAINQADADAQSLMASLDLYANNQRNRDRDGDITKIRTIFADAKATRGEIIQLLQLEDAANDEIATALYLNSYKPKLDEVSQILTNFSTTAKSRADVQRVEVSDMMNLTWMTLVAIAVISMAVCIGIGLLIRKSLLAPIREIVRAYTEIAKGNMKEHIQYESKDELGQMAALIKKSNELQETILGDIIEKFIELSKGNMRIHVNLEYPGDFAVLKEALEKTTKSLNYTLNTINDAAYQVDNGASQVSSGAMALASGSSQQASSVEELSAAVTQIAQQASDNAGHVRNAAQFVQETSRSVKMGDEQMEKLTNAMEQLNQSSRQITNIIKVIEDIAFQTNILALNAAIEAARAGTAGKGFAVVADEVRNLAAKSGDAAKQTAELILSSVAMAEEGTAMTSATADILRVIDEKTSQVKEIMDRINRATAEQETAIMEVKLGLNQVSSVIQTNAATAEENSAASQEMSAQATILKDQVNRFQLEQQY